VRTSEDGALPEESFRFLNFPRGPLTFFIPLGENASLKIDDVVVVWGYSYRIAGLNMGPSRRRIAVRPMDDTLCLPTPYNDTFLLSASEMDGFLPVQPQELAFSEDEQPDYHALATLQIGQRVLVGGEVYEVTAYDVRLGNKVLDVQLNTVEGAHRLLNWASPILFLV
jgi:hypothetical protein